MFTWNLATLGQMVGLITIGTCFVNNTSLWNWLYLRKKHGLSLFSLPSIITDLQTSCFRSQSPRCASCHSVSGKRVGSSPLLPLNRVSRHTVSALTKRYSSAVTVGRKVNILNSDLTWFINVVTSASSGNAAGLHPVQWLLCCLVTGLAKHFRSAENVCFRELFEFGVFCILRVFGVDPFQWFYRTPDNCVQVLTEYLVLPMLLMASCRIGICCLQNMSSTVKEPSDRPCCDATVL